MFKKITPDPPCPSMKSTPEEKATFIRQSINNIFTQLDSEPSAAEMLVDEFVDQTDALPPETPHPPKQSLFAVHEDLDLQNALTNVSQLLKTAEYVADDIRTGASGIATDQLWTVTHSVEMARAVVDRLLGKAGALSA